MHANLSMSEYTDWVAYFSVDWDKFRPKQPVSQMQENLKFSLAVVKPKKKKRK